MTSDRRRLIALVVLAVVGVGIYAAIAGLSRQFVVGREHADRPILAVLGLLAVAFVCYLVAIGLAVRVGRTGRLLGLIAISSVAFRVVLAFSWPIQEVDIYRYLWDGAATTAGVSPFRYSPDQVREASAETDLPDDLRSLVELRDDVPELADILDRVHYGELPTIYPPVSQAVFAACTLVTPREATVFERLVTMKICFMLFDLATLALVVDLLRRTGRHVGWSLAYGWCPLLVKEVSNSGHLDAVAVFLTTAAVWVATRSFFELPGSRRCRARHCGALVAAALLALAVGAKLYPVVLVPLFAAAGLKRLGWRGILGPAVVFAAIAVIVLWPMVPRGASPAVAETASDAPDDDTPPIPDDLDQPPDEVSRAEPQDPSLGLTTFLRRWEMNDFLFMLLLENTRPQGETPPERMPWFSVVPQSWRVALLKPPAEYLDLDLPSTAFLTTRAVTGGAFLLLAVALAARVYRRGGTEVWLEAAFLTVAWLWLLSPTQNPWYWTWAMPLVAFARGRAWLAVSGLALIYYLRFWLGYHLAEEPVLGTAYHGEAFFDFVVTWLEFGPWLIWLALAWWYRKCVAPHRSGTNKPSKIEPGTVSIFP
ncbi:MAG: DUF2029 domain-containing protein [Planctomycetes bacterium]|nr:DUF2029 domain-containing protein [Planctomycetota bacterium]